MRLLFAMILCFATPAPTVFAACNESLGAVRQKQDTIRLRNGFPLYYELYEVADAKGVFVFSNGLEYALSNYAKTIKALNNQGYSVLIYAHRAQHQSLAAANTLNLKFESFTYKDLADDLEELLNEVGILEPIHLAAISFGAAPAAEFAKRHPQRVHSLTFLAPLVSLLTSYTMVRGFQDMFGLLSSPYERMISSVENFDLSKFAFEVPTTLVLAGTENPYLRQQQDRYWQSTLSGQGGALVELKKANHVMPSSAPLTLAKTLVRIAARVFEE